MPWLHPTRPASVGRRGNLRDVHDARLAELDPATLYRILALRSAVFVVEQDCVYPDLDGRDLEPAARQLWVEQDGAVLATLRLLHDPDGRARIGRVATAHAARGDGLAARLMARALELADGATIVLDAQAYLVGWYARFGFEADGPEFVEDGIPHVPMRRGASWRSTRTRWAWRRIPRAAGTARRGGTSHHETAARHAQPRHLRGVPAPAR